MSRAMFKYDGAMIKLIHRFKFGDQVHLAEFFAEQLIKLYNEDFAAQGIHCIIPVPLSEGRLKHRSYNQTQLLAKILSRQLSLPVYNNVLIKVKETAPQSRLNSAQRYENVKHAYRVVNNHQFKNKNVLLIDDVITTGATTNACTKVLMRAGAKRVYVMAIAMNI
ncbi:MAG: ComF family protein [bacterium]